ncbi:MAG: hypothetical protein ABSG05_03435 [Candidatus Pacearchaeota archaeon]|jgi:hypothetical protein
MLGNLITGFLIILVGVNIAPTVASQVQVAVYPWSNGTGPGANLTPSDNFTNGSGAVLTLVTLFFVLAVAVAAMDIAVVGLRQSGLVI